MRAVSTVSAIALLASVAGMSLSGTANASPIVTFSSGTIADSVQGLVVGSNVYNVDFVGDVSSSAWSSMLDFTTETDANAAASSLAAALNTAGATGASLTNGANEVVDAFYLSIFYVLDGANLLSAILSSGGGAIPWSTGNSSYPNAEDYFPFAADFTLVGPVGAVPVPAAIPLIATGIGIFGLMGWRKKRARTA